MDHKSLATAVYLLSSLVRRLWRESLVHTFCACARMYGKESVNVSVNDLGHVLRSSMELQKLHTSVLRTPCCVPNTLFE